MVLSDEVALKTKRKIRTILSVGLKHNHDSIVLGSFGCGAFRNPPESIAQLFKEIIEELDGYYKRITFAILDDHNTGKVHNKQGNFTVFQAIFGQ